MISYNYQIEHLLIAVAYSFLGSFSFFSTVQRIRYIDNLKVAIIFVVISSILVSACSVWCTHFLIIFSMEMENKLELYVDVRLTIVSLITAIVCNVIGFYISFFSYLKRCIQEYKKKNLTANLSINSTAIFSNMTSDIKETNLIINKEESKIVEYTEYKHFFMNFKLIKRDYLRILLGGFLIGTSIILLHIVGMMAIGFNGNLVFDKPHQIWISLLGAIACLVINIGLFYKDNLLVKFLMSIIFSASVFAVHCISVHFTTFENSVNQTSFNPKSYFVDLSTCSKILFVSIALLNFIFREITNFYLNSSFLLLQKIKKHVYKNDKNLNDVVIYINNLIRLKEQRASRKVKSDEKFLK
jgi:NO-binding membrane sensor protein with MHYT domain